MRKFLYFCFALVLCLPAAPGRTAEQVVLQLKWLHAYQFAGYYMAKEKGYYRDAGLNVDIREGGPRINFVDEVVSGRAHYATGATGILLDRIHGKPVVVLGVIFQHSPDVLFVSKASGITHPQQLVGKTIMDSASTPAIAPMLLNETGSLEKFNLIPQDNDYQGLIEGKFDAIGGYSTDETFFYREQQFPVTLLKPITYGIDFYGDNLFTSENELSKHPERVNAFRLASFKGWEYAMKHPEETLGIVQKYGSTRTTEHLRFEYAAMRELLVPEFVPVGFMNRGRWKNIADTYVRLSQLQPEYSLAGFLYDPNPAPNLEQLKKYIISISTVTLGTIVIILMLVFFNRRLAQQKEALRFSEQRMRLATEATKVGIWEWNVITNKIRWDAMMFQIYGIAPTINGFVEYSDWSGAVLPEELRRQEEVLQDTVRRLGRSYREFHIRRRDDRECRLIQAVETVRTNAQGQAEWVVGTNLDITERKLAEEEKNKQSQLSLQYKEILLALSQQQFGNILDHFHAITEAAARALNVERVGLWTLNNNILECEDLYLASTGAHQHFAPYALPDDSPYINALQHHEVIRTDNARTDPRTSEFGALFASRDIHSLMDVPIWRQGRMVGVLGCDHTGMDRHWTDLEEEFASHLAAVASVALEAEERRRAEKAIIELNENLEQRVAERTAELSKVNAELECAKNAAANASEAKSDFLSRMSHELRTPLHAILGFSQLLEGSFSNATPEEKKSVRQILYSGQHLLELINETLDLARIEEGKLELILEDLDLNHSICIECLEQVRGLAEKNNIAVHLKAGASPIVVYADRIRLKQVLLNLLSNAIKYNRPQGSVTLEYHASRKERVRVTITDTGVGIARDQQDRVFQPFTRIHHHDSAIEGTGIGLTITRRLVEEMGGEIGFTSEVGVGSTFWFELRAGRKTPRVNPLTTTAGERIAATSTTPAIKGKVLYIEDTTANVQLMRMIVKRLPGVEFLDTNTAEFGIVLAMEQRPDLILMDIDLPGMDGIEALQRLRQEEKTRDIQVIAVSAAVMAHDLERIQEAGFDDILSKPFNIQSVPALLLKHLGNRRAITG